MSALFSAWVYGDGRYQQNYQLSPAQDIVINAFGKVVIQNGKQNQLTLIAEQDVSPFIELTLDQEQLIITDTRVNSFWFQAQQLWWRLMDKRLDVQPVTYQLTLSAPEKITLNGHLTTQVKQLSTTSLTVNANGLGQLLLEDLQLGQLAIALNGKFDTRVNNVNAETLDLSFNGTGSVKTHNLLTDELRASINGSIDSHLAGRTDELHLQMKGSGKCQGHGFATERAFILLSGTSQLTLKVNQQLTATSEDDSQLFYYGNPETRVEGNASTHLVGGYQAKIYY
ncbi:DUF2807 domain-containing protein [Simiduia curdlanivorans]|uniref:GIN domain-containing protein n=1 Tax=Simiduia curdlanivorans TaxID=1492769 RepID=A0ABV8V6Y9_9GAMM|nr:DUF2807 domain-containing protein [Simiduia curdlanivorans]MDN3640559.1 DUF2807 domain-containing protein [Simiduia curdlanivorans]